MSKNLFTEEQKEIIEKNPYVLSCTDKYINYQEEFKELFLIKYNEGMLPSQIFTDCGFDTKILGQKRIKNFTYRTKKQSTRVDGFKDTRKENSGRPRTKDLTVEEENEILKNKVRSLKEENDFLKRVRFINKRQISKQSKTKLQNTNSN